MTDEEKELDKASKASALAVLGTAAATSIALFTALPPFIPLVSIPLFTLGALQRLTERPWLATAAVVWSAAVALFWGQPLIGAASAVSGFFVVRHWLLLRRTRFTLPKP